MLKSNVRKCSRRIWVNTIRGYKPYVRILDDGTRPERRTWIRREPLIFTVVALGLGVPFYLLADYFQDNPYSSTAFQSYTIEDKKIHSSTSSIFTAKPQSKVDWSQEWQRGLWSVEIKQPQLQIAREYTPLPPDNIGKGTADLVANSQQLNGSSLEFWIRREERGEVSSYLHKLEPGSSIEIRGPKSVREIPEAQEIVFLAGGTGIAPAFQLAHALLDRSQGSSDLPNLHILWANRRREDCVGGISDNISQPSRSGILGFLRAREKSPLSQEKSVLVERLEKLKAAYNGRLRIDYFIDEEDSCIKKERVISLLKSNKDEDQMRPKRVVMVCGPDGFVNHFAGPKQWQNGKQIQGQISGVLQDASKLGWEVVKL